MLGEGDIPFSEKIAINSVTIKLEKIMMLLWEAGFTKEQVINAFPATDAQLQSPIQPAFDSVRFQITTDFWAGENPGTLKTTTKVEFTEQEITASSFEGMCILLKKLNIQIIKYNFNIFLALKTALSTGDTFEHGTMDELAGKLGGLRLLHIDRIGRFIDYFNFFDFFTKKTYLYLYCSILGRFSLSLDQLEMMIGLPPLWCATIGERRTRIERSIIGISFYILGEI